MSENVKIHMQRSYKVMHFMVQQTQMCIHLQNVHKILPLVELTIVPGSENYLVGIMNMGGKSIQVIDMALCAGLERHESYSIETPILLCQNNKTIVGFIIDKVIGLTDVTDSSIQMETEIKKQNSLFMGSIVEGSQHSLLINIAYFTRDKTVSSGKTL